MKRKSYLLGEGVIKASLLDVWLDAGDRTIGLRIGEDVVKEVYHKRARLILEVEP